jgi:hypothetical protein
VLFNLPTDYVVSKYLQYAGYAKFKRLSNVYEASCPICREGNSWGKKKRSFYLIKKNAICCHNCGWYSNPYKWVKKVSGLNDIEIINEVKAFDTSFLTNIKEEDIPIKNIKTDTLPENSINLFDPNQIEFYKENKIVKIALSYITDRRLDTAVNKPQALFLSLTDRVHKNRLIIPFYYKNKIVFYQTRTLLQSDNKVRPKYLSKIGGEKTLFNFDNITSDVEHIFLFEGPIDSCFVKNGMGLTGIQEKSKKTFSAFQHNQLNEINLYKRIFVLDSQWQDEASLRKSRILLDQGENVFIWPEKLGKRYKDFNEICIDMKRDYIKPSFIVDHSSTGLKGVIELSKITKYKD